MISAVIAAYAGALAFLIAAAFLNRERRHLQQMARQKTEQATNDRALARWAQSTMLSVVDTAGHIHAATVDELAHRHDQDRTWVSPLYVSLWHGTDEQITQYREEMHPEEYPGG